MAACTSAVLWLNGIPLIGQSTFCLSFHLGCLQFWDMRNNATMKVRVQVTESLCIPGSAIARPHGASLLKRGSEGCFPAEAGNSGYCIAFLSQITPDR